MRTPVETPVPELDLVDVQVWSVYWAEIARHIGAVFARSEMRTRAMAYLAGPLSMARKVASWQARLPSLTTTRIRCRLCRQGGTAPPLSKKRTKQQRRQRQGRGARSAPALHEECGQKPTPRWAFPHARPHERTVRESPMLRSCRTLSNPSLFPGRFIGPFWSPFRPFSQSS